MRWRGWASVAACLAIIAGALAYNHWRSTRLPEAVIARVKATASNVYITREGGIVVAVVNMPLYAGDRIATKSGQHATFVY